MFQVKVTVANLQAPERSFQDPFWVDTGALDSFAPEDRLETIGIVPKFARDFVFADGKKDRRLVGEAAFSIEGTDEAITCLIVFGPPGSLLLLGATALENFCVRADPTTQKLRPITAIIGTASASRTVPLAKSRVGAVGGMPAPAFSIRGSRSWRVVGLVSDLPLHDCGEGRSQEPALAGYRGDSGHALIIGGWLGESAGG